MRKPAARFVPMKKLLDLGVVLHAHASDVLLRGDAVGTRRRDFHGLPDDEAQRQRRGQWQKPFVSRGKERHRKPESLGRPPLRGFPLDDVPDRLRLAEDEHRDEVCALLDRDANKPLVPRAQRHDVIVDPPHVLDELGLSAGAQHDGAALAQAPQETLPRDVPGARPHHDVSEQRHAKYDVRAERDR
eukprot:30937-Pelagococcus_subviridis.AAC.8